MRWSLNIKTIFTADVLLNFNASATHAQIIIVKVLLEQLWIELDFILNSDEGAVRWTRLPYFLSLLVLARFSKLLFAHWGKEFMEAAKINLCKLSMVGQSRDGVKMKRTLRYWQTQGEVIETLKPGKAPGEDEVYAQMLKTGGVWAAIARPCQKYRIAGVQGKYRKTGKLDLL